MMNLWVSFLFCFYRGTLWTLPPGLAGSSVRNLLPARLGDAWDQAVGGQLTEGDT